MQIIISFDNLDYFKITNLKLSVGRWFDSHTFIFIVRYITCIFLINVLVNCLTMLCIAALMISGQNSKKARRKTLQVYKKYSSPFYFRPFLQQEHSSLILEQLWSGLNTCTCLILRKYFFLIDTGFVKTGTHKHNSPSQVNVSDSFCYWRVCG